MARAALLEMAEQIERLTAGIAELDIKIIAAVKADDTARRLTIIPGVGPIIAAAARVGVYVILVQKVTLSKVLE